MNIDATSAANANLKVTRTLEAIILPSSMPISSSTPEAQATPVQAEIPTTTPTVLKLPDRPLAGIQTSRTKDAKRIKVIADAGSAWIHYTALEWDRIEPVRKSPPAFRWEMADEKGMRLAVENGLTLIANVSFAPSWAQKVPGYACGPVAQDEFHRFGIFLQEAVLRYSNPPYNVKYWELGNEPDVLPWQVEPRSGFGCWGDASDPFYGGGYYAEMLKVVYPFIKAADPDAQVLIGGLLLACDPDEPYLRDDGSAVDCNSTRFLEGILQNGGGEYFDGVSFHAYDYYYEGLGAYGHLGWHTDYTNIGPVLIEKTNFIRKLLDQYGYPNKDLLATEVAVLCRSTGKEAPCLTEDFENTKAYYAVYSLSSAYANHLDAFIWYELEGWRASELVRSNLAPLPAYDSFQFAASQFENAAFVRPVDIPGTIAYEFIDVKSSRHFWLLWSKETGETPLLLPQMPEAIYNVWGEVLPNVDAIMLTQAPIYVFWPPDVRVEPAP